MACPENCTLKEFVENFIKPKKLETLDQRKGEGHARAFYPSVECGFINIDKLSQFFKPTSLKVAIEASISFFQCIQIGQYNSEKAKMVKELPSFVRAHVEFSDVEKIEGSYSHSTGTSNSSED